MRKIVDEIRTRLAQAGDEATRLGAERFFKEPIRTHGVKAAAVRKIARDGLKKLKGADKETVFALCEELLSRRYVEEVGVACEWTYSRRGEFTPSDMDVFERWVDNHIGNWAACDTLCNHSVADLVTMYPELAQRLIQWTHAENRWKKRAAAVTLIIPARKGLFHDTVYAIADILLTDQDDMVQKGYGWALKAAGEADPEAVFGFVTARKDRMPRTAYRYAIEKLPGEMRARAMKK